MRRWIERARELCDSPNLLQDLITMFSAVRLCVWFMLTNIVLGIALAAGIMVGMFSNEPQIANVGFGQFVGMLVFLALLALLTLLVPIRTLGLIFLPRSGKYMDQIVLSGISPLRFMSGKVVGVNLFALMIIAGALPYFVFSYFLGDLSLWFVIRGIVLLQLYANLLCLVTLTGAMLSQEWANVLGVFVLFGFLWFLGMFPIPAVTAVVCPSRFFMEPIYSQMLELQGMNISFNVASVAIQPGVNLCFLSYPFAIALCGVYLLIGPLNCIALPNSTFGEVIMPGDSRRRSAFRRHRLLQRRSEISFLYENRSEWISRIDLPLRWGTLLVVILISAGIPLAALHLFSRQFEPLPFTMTSISVVAVICGLSAVVLSNDKGGEWTVTRFHRLNYRAGVVDTVFFVFVVTFLLALALGLPFLRTCMSDYSWLAAPLHGKAVSMGIGIFPITWIFFMWLYALHRSVAMASWNRGAGAVAAAVVGGLLFFIPVFIPYIVTNLPRRLNVPSWLKLFSAAISYISPAPHAMQMVGLADEMDLPDEVAQLHLIGTIFTYVIHLGLLILFTFLAVRSHKRLNPWGAGR